jgi:DNA-binding HxlR family transcriptional regulator
MDAYGQFCPVAQAAEILTRRWTPLVVRELLCGSHRFNDLHCGVPRMSRSLLARRLGELEEVGIVERRLVGAGERPEYHLTEAGEELRPIIFELGFWGKRWLTRKVSREALDPGLLMWDMQRRILRDRLPPRRVVVSFEFTDAPPHQERYWLILEPEQVDLCLRDPGIESDLRVRSDVRTLAEIWLGELEFLRALREESLSLAGKRELRRSFPGWLGLSVFADPAGAPRPTPGGALGA